MSRNYISPAMLPMDAISQYMEKVYGFGKKTEASNDTKNVDGIKSSLVAKAATDEKGNLLTDRETVKNALDMNLNMNISSFGNIQGNPVLIIHF